MSRRRLDLQGETEVLETSNETSGDLGVVSTFEIVGPEFVYVTSSFRM